MRAISATREGGVQVRVLRLSTAIVTTCLVILFANAAHGQVGPLDRLTVALPNAAWLVEIRTPGFTVQKDEVSSDASRRYVYAVGRDPDATSASTNWKNGCEAGTSPNVAVAGGGATCSV